MLRKLLFVGIAASGLVGWFAPASAMKVRASVKKMGDKEVKIVKRDGIDRVIIENVRDKAKQG